MDRLLKGVLNAFRQAIGIVKGGVDGIAEGEGGVVDETQGMASLELCYEFDSGREPDLVSGLLL